MDNTAGQSIKSSYVYLDSISFASSTYTHVWCFIVDLAGKLKQFAPKFIIGGDILKRDPWCFDLKTCQLQRLNNLPTNVATSLAWKNYADAGLNIIHFKGKIAGKKTRIHFDTGARFNAVLPTSELIKPTDDGSEEPRLNASFLMGKKWVLDYEHRQLLILSQ